jgi:phosphinothricin acetyltransferase
VLETRAVLRQATEADAAAVAAIYNHYVEHSVATFEEVPVAPSDMASRIMAVRERGLPWLVAVPHDDVVGYAYAGPWKARSGYRRTVETSVYVHPEERRRGLGTALCRDLLERLRALGVHAVIAGIALPNDDSVRLHERLGLRRIALFSEVGFKHGRWVDVAYWQTLLPDTAAVAVAAPSAP